MTTPEAKSASQNWGPGALFLSVTLKPSPPGSDSSSEKHPCRPLRRQLARRAGLRGAPLCCELLHMAGPCLRYKCLDRTTMCSLGCRSLNPKVLTSCEETRAHRQGTAVERYQYMEILYYITYDYSSIFLSAGYAQLSPCG